jgi:hypothetical protein
MRPALSKASARPLIPAMATPVNASEPGAALVVAVATVPVVPVVSVVPWSVASLVPAVLVSLAPVLALVVLVWDPLWALDELAPDDPALLELAWLDPLPDVAALDDAEPEEPEPDDAAPESPGAVAVVLAAAVVSAGELQLAELAPPRLA